MRPCFMPQQHPLWLVGAQPGFLKGPFLRQIQVVHNRFFVKVYRVRRLKECGESGRKPMFPEA